MTTVKEIFEKVEKKLTERPDEFLEIGAVFKFVLSGPEGGTWIIDLRKDTFGMRAGDEEANCTFKASDENFIKLVTGKLKAEYALMTGKVKFFGDFGLLIKLRKLFGK